VNLVDYLYKLKKSNTVILTTIYPASERYLDQFFNSLVNQSTKDFDVLVLNDGVKDFDIYRLRYTILNLVEINVSGSGSFVKIRELGINTIRRLGYHYIIFGDSDDYFSENRVEKVRVSLGTNHIVVNELTLVSDRIKVRDFLKTNLINLNALTDHIINSNIFGFSNTALRVDILKEPVNFGDNLLAGDWYFFSTILLHFEYKIEFLDDVQTFYRQHENNFVGFSLGLTEEKLEIGLNVKLAHYKELINYCSKNNMTNHLQRLIDSINSLERLRIELMDQNFREKYIEFVNLILPKIFSGWWSEIVTMEYFLSHYDSNKMRSKPL